MCRHYLKRKPGKGRLPNNWWHDPYDTINQAEVGARDHHIIHVRKCRTCSP